MSEVLVILIATAALVIIEGADFLFNHVLFPGEVVEPLPPEEVIDESLMNEVDHQLIRASWEILEEHLGEKPADNLMTLTPDDRIQALSGIVKDLVHLYGVEITGVEFTALPNTTAGCYLRSRRLIQINYKWVMADRQDILFDLLDTIFHELRHAIQWDIVTCGGKNRGVSEEYRKKLAESFWHYIPAERNIRGYQTQLVEKDAVTFAACVLREAVTT